MYIVCERDLETMVYRIHTRSVQQLTSLGRGGFLSHNVPSGALGSVGKSTRNECALIRGIYI